MAAKPHVSEALRQLRRWVILASAAVCLAAITQMVVFACVHYTDLRWTTVRGEAIEEDLKVVVGSDAAGGGARVSAKQVRSGRVPADVDARPADPNRVLSGTDAVLETASALATTGGLIACVSLAVFTLMGVVIAGGGAVPGVERAVTASVWGLWLGVGCFPWQDVLPSAWLPGVFMGYAQMTSASEAVLAGGAGGGGLVIRMVVVPIVATVVAALVCVWFLAGVERGIILTSVSEIDEVMEREIASIRARGVSGAVPRSFGALNRALGDRPEPVGKVAAGAESMGAVGGAAGLGGVGGLGGGGPLPGLSRSLLREDSAGGDEGRRPI